MKVLLAPLYFRQHFCKECARLHYKSNPGSWPPNLFEFERLPPLGSFDTNRGFIPDFPTLLMFEEFVLDGEAFERLKQPGKRLWLKEWSELVAALESEGSLTAVDVSAAAKARRHQCGWMLRRDLVDPQRWVEPMRYCNALMNRAQWWRGGSTQQAEDLSWDFDPDAAFGVDGEDGKVHSLSSVLYEGGESGLNVPRNLFTSAFDVVTNDNVVDNVKDQLREVNACLAACAELGVAPIMWAPYRRYLEEKLRLSPDTNAVSGQAAGQQFFEVAFPAYNPTTVRAFARVRSDKRIKALRAEILGASKTGELLDPKYPQRILTEVLRLEQDVARMRRIAGWIASAVGTIPISGLGLVASVAAEAVTSWSERKRREPWHWFYLISDGRGGT